MPRLPARGFTLVEVMVVIAIIAILVTMVSLSLRGDRAGEQIEEEARRLAALLNLLREEAVMRDTDLGLVLTAEGYHFVQAAPMDPAPDGPAEEGMQAASGSEASAEVSVFRPLTDDGIFRARTLPAGSVLRFEAGPSAQGISAASGMEMPVILAIAQDLLLPEGRLILTHPATTRVAAIRIRTDGAIIEEQGDGR